ncbi:MAG: hypothetical protein IJW48_04245 [Clostridia bacterium]|nr:hypothetical protein [Clostridia bacterium]
MENKTFIYQYSATRKREVEAIRNKYCEKEENKLDILKRLDGKVETAGQIESLILGIVGILIFGVGMCFGLGVLGDARWLSVVLGILGAALMLPAYPVYKHLREKTMKKLVPEILRISDEIIKNEK